MKFVLASGSPRRKELLKDLGLSFEICPSNAEESFEKNMTFYEICESLSSLKATDVFNSFTQEEEVCVIGADTIVVCGDNVLGKPKDETDAFNMLKLLQNRSHFVYTGTTVIIKQRNNIKKITYSDKTEVFMVKLSDEEIKSYVKSGEPMDKAGSYAIQGKGAAFIDKIYGNYFNVVGLNICRLYELLKENSLV
ncbi:MAG: Maf family protein [Clostridiales bacterium]|nr:Maf family protein [Clostridiales bacterium]